MVERADVVVVGGGIAGSSLAFALAGEGLGVTVLEGTVEFPDRVRGESMQPWGVAEARALGVEDVLLAAGAHTAPLWNQFTEGLPEPVPIPTGLMLEGVAGSLNLWHPAACQSLLDAAAAAGATVVRGVEGLELRRDDGDPVLAYGLDGHRHEVASSLVVGADGRNSAVRRQTGIALQHQEATSFISGLLLDGLDGVPDDFDILSDAGDHWALLFHQGGGRARAYVCTGMSDRHRFAGPAGTTRFLEVCGAACHPWAAQVASATPAGPCATYPGDDTWTAQPYVDGVVLIGDAAGHNDPIVGQGLSLAVRDARSVRDLVLEGARAAADFDSYGAERVGRMARVRLLGDMMAAVQAEDAPNRPARRALFGALMAAMDPELAPLFTSAFAGPEILPDELLDGGWVDRIRAA